MDVRKRARNGQEVAEEDRQEEAAEEGQEEKAVNTDTIYRKEVNNER